MGALPWADGRASPTALGTLTIHMPSKGTWAWNSDTMSCHQSRASGLVKSGKAVNPGHTCRKGQRGDQAPPELQPCSSAWGWEGCGSEEWRQ